MEKLFLNFCIPRIYSNGTEINWASVASDLINGGGDFVFEGRNIRTFHTIEDTTFERVSRRKRGKAAYRDHIDLATIIEFSKIIKNADIILPISNIDCVGQKCKGIIGYNRLCSHPNSFLWPLTYHVEEARKGYDDKTSFSDKKDAIIFRGALSTSLENTETKASRFSVCLNWKNKNDRIKLFLSYTPDHAKKHSKYEKYKTQIIGVTLGKLDRSELMENKYILCLEGADVSTSLGWVLSSNCVPIVPVPLNHEVWYYCALEPFQNFIPCKYDCSDLDKVLEWCDGNQEAVRKISESGRELSKIIFEEGFVSKLKEEFIKKWKLNKKHFQFV